MKSDNVHDCLIAPLRRKTVYRVPKTSSKSEHARKRGWRKYPTDKTTMPSFCMKVAGWISPLLKSRLKCSVGFNDAVSHAGVIGRFNALSINSQCRGLQLQLNVSYPIVDARLLQQLLTSPISPRIGLISQPPRPDAPENSNQYT